MFDSLEKDGLEGCVPEELEGLVQAAAPAQRGAAGDQQRPIPQLAREFAEASEDARTEDDLFRRLQFKHQRREPFNEGCGHALQDSPVGAVGQQRRTGRGDRLWRPPCLLKSRTSRRENE